MLSALPAQAQSGAIREIRVAGNRRVEPETVRSYLRFNVGDAYDAGKVDQSIKSLFATGLFSDVRIDREGAGVLVTVVENPVINQVAFEGNREVDKATLTSEVQLKPRSRVHPRPRAGRRAAHPRRLPPAGPVCRLGRAQDHRARQQPREPRVRDQRGRRDQGQGHQFHRQQGLLRQPAARHHHHHAVGPVRLPQGHQHLRSRPAGARSRAAAPVLPEERLCRRARRLRRAPSSIATARGFYITFVVDEGELFKFGKIDIESALPTRRPQGAARRAADRRRHDLRPVADGQDDGAADARRLRAGLCLRPRAPARRARARRAHRSTSRT